MKKFIYAILALVLILEYGCQNAVGGDSVSLSTKIDSISYAHGVNFHSGANGLGNLGVDLNPDLYLEGFKAVQQDDPSWPYDRAMVILGNFSRELQTRNGRPFTESDPLQTNVDSISIALGVYDSYTYKGCGFEVNGDAVCAGIKDAQYENEQLGQEVLSKLNGVFDQEFNMALTAEREKAGDENKLKGAQFLAENKDKEGVKVTESGLQYKVLEEGTGAMPTTASTVKVHYEGRLISGDVFDSSYGKDGKGNPIEFGVTQVIRGWTEGLQLMKVGSKYQFYIPSDLAYGARGAGGDIGAHETLIFDVELIDIK